MFINGDFYYDNGLHIKDGLFYFYETSYASLVIEVKNNFVPLNYQDAGGIVVEKPEYTYGFFEFGESMEDVNYQYIRVEKQLNTYSGSGSTDGTNWIEKGSRYIKDGELIGVMYNNEFMYENTYNVEEVKLYLDSSFTITDLPIGGTVEIFDSDNNLIGSEVIDDSGIVKSSLSSYPQNLMLKAYDFDNNLIINSTITDVWGGDIYCTSIDVDLFNNKHELLELETSKFLGTVYGDGELMNEFYIHNNTNTTFPATIRIAKCSPAYNWVTLSYDIYENEKEIIVPLQPLETKSFIIYIEAPYFDSLQEQSSDYNSNTNMVFYLEVV